MSVTDHEPYPFENDAVNLGLFDTIKQLPTPARRMNNWSETVET